MTEADTTAVEPEVKPEVKPEVIPEVELSSLEKARAAKAKKREDAQAEFTVSFEDNSSVSLDEFNKLKDELGVIRKERDKTKRESLITHINAISPTLAKEHKSTKDIDTLETILSVAKSLVDVKEPPQHTEPGEEKPPEVKGIGTYDRGSGVWT